MAQTALPLVTFVCCHPAPIEHFAQLAPALEAQGLRCQFLAKGKAAEGLEKKGIR